MAFDLGFSLDDLKGYLGYPVGSPSDTTSDFVLNIWMAAALATIKTLTGRNLALGVYRDTFGYYPGHLYLKERPVVEVLSITFGDNVITPEVDCQVFKETGRVEFFSHWQSRYFHSWATGRNRLVIDYYGGYETMPAQFQMAALAGIQAADIANKQASSSSFGGGLGVIKQLTVADVGSVSYQTRAQYTSAVLQQAISENLANYLSSGIDGYNLGTPLLQESEYLADMPGSPTL